MWWISRVTVQKSSSFRTLHRTEEDRTSSREGARGRDRESKGIDLDPPWWSPYPPPHHHHPWCCRLWNCISTPKSSSFLGFARHSRPMQTKRKCILQNFQTSFLKVWCQNKHVTKYSTSIWQENSVVCLICFCFVIKCTLEAWWGPTVQQENKGLTALDARYWQALFWPEGITSHSDQLPCWDLCWVTGQQGGGSVCVLAVCQLLLMVWPFFKNET